MAGPGTGSVAACTPASTSAIQTCSSSDSPSSSRPPTCSRRASPEPSGAVTTSRPSRAGTGRPVTKPASASRAATSQPRSECPPHQRAARAWRRRSPPRARRATSSEFIPPPSGRTCAATPQRSASSGPGPLTRLRLTRASAISMPSWRSDSSSTHCTSRVSVRDMTGLSVQTCGEAVLHLLGLVGVAAPGLQPLDAPRAAAPLRRTTSRLGWWNGGSSSSDPPVPTTSARPGDGRRARGQ